MNSWVCPAGKVTKSESTLAKRGCHLFCKLLDHHLKPDCLDLVQSNSFSLSKILRAHAYQCQLLKTPSFLINIVEETIEGYYGYDIMLTAIKE